MIAKLLGAITLRLVGLVLLIFAFLHIIVGIGMPDRMNYLYAGLCFLASAFATYRLGTLALNSAIHEAKDLQD